MIKTVKASLSEKILFIFLLSLAVLVFGSFFLIKNKCLFVKNIDLTKLQFEFPENIAVMNVECGKVIVELYPEVAPKAVERFKYFLENHLYDGSTFYRVIEDTLMQAGDLEFGHKDTINYSKVGSGKSGLGNLKSELSDTFEFNAGSIALARGDTFDTEDSEFFIILKDIPLYQGEYTPIGKVIFGLDALKKIKIGNKSEYVLRPDFINSFRLIN